MRFLLPAVALVSFNAAAQPYPSRPITLVVPYTPGTGIDIIARTVGPKLSERWKEAVIVDNNPGASGNIRAAAGAKAPPRRHTLKGTGNNLSITPSPLKCI